MECDDGWTETVPELCPLPEGYLNNLDDEHWTKLYKMWDTFFAVCDRAKGSKKQKESAGFSEDWGVDTEAAKKSGGISGASKLLRSSGIEKEDDAKAAAQARTEEANMEDLLSTYGPEALRNTFWGMCKRDNPDITMLRFLRARKWNVEHTTSMLASTLKWRLDTNLDALLENGDLENGKQIPKYVENFEENGKIFTLGTSSQNQPVMYIQFAKHIMWAQPSATTKKFILAHLELIRLLVVPPNDKVILIFDCTGFGPSNMDVVNLLYVLQCLQSYFPETLVTLYLHKAPWILQQAWHLVKWLLDPIVRAKVQFTNKPHELMNVIPKEHLLKHIGGEVDIDFDWVPSVEGENDLHSNTAERNSRRDNHRRLCQQFEDVTRLWCASSGEECQEERRILGKKLRLSHFDYEPYWLGSWVHHRNGNLPVDNPGIVRWQYPMINGAKVREVMGHEESRRSIVRELQEIAVGASVDFAEARTKQLLKEGTWGDWRTCDGMPSPPTGFSSSDDTLMFEQDGGVAASIDLIGLRGPETLAEARMLAASHVVGQQPQPVLSNGFESSSLNEFTLQAEKKAPITQTKIATSDVPLASVLASQNIDGPNGTTTPEKRVEENQRTKTNGHSHPRKAPSATLPPAKSTVKRGATAPHKSRKAAEEDLYDYDDPKAEKGSFFQTFKSKIYR
ncbi:hypothetical protein CBS101457_004858 [Exobasidium rhododendri]|nr:hypothetical protein CBS101457_004858 [Exobasidium rhododendri]